MKVLALIVHADYIMESETDCTNFPGPRGSINVARHQFHMSCKLHPCVRMSMSCITYIKT